MVFTVELKFLSTADIAVTHWRLKCYFLEIGSYNILTNVDWKEDTV